MRVGESPTLWVVFPAWLCNLLFKNVCPHLVCNSTSVFSEKNVYSISFLFHEHDTVISLKDFCFPTLHCLFFLVCCFFWFFMFFMLYVFLQCLDVFGCLLMLKFGRRVWMDRDFHLVGLPVGWPDCFIEYSLYVSNLKVLCLVLLNFLREW